ncbi:MAG: DUF167 domain-containing protein [Verrucomicrobiales bacterium]|nr:DUF167 domain-containing protein [Verrucomicrobiales bacterium]
MTPPSWLRILSDGVELHLRIQPRASRTEIAGVMGDALKIRVAAPPVDDAANAALLRFLADRLGCPRSAVGLIRGRSARQKVVKVRDVPPDQVLRQLGPGDN